MVKLIKQLYNLGSQCRSTLYMVIAEFHVKLCVCYNVYHSHKGERFQPIAGV